MDQRRRQSGASASTFQPTGRVTRGRKTAGKTRSRRGRTIRYRIRPEKRSSSATRKPVRSRQRRRHQSATAGPTSRAMALGIAASSTRRRACVSTSLQFVPLADPVKISRLTIRNMSDRPRRLSVTAYAEWVLGTSRGASDAVHRDTRSMRLMAPFSRPQSLEHRLSPAEDRLLRSRRAADGLDGRPRRIYRSQWGTRSTRRAGPWRGAVRYGRCRNRPMRCARNEH